LENSKINNQMEQLTRTTKEIIFEKIKQLEIEIKHYEDSLEDESFSKFHQMTRVEIEMMEMQITFFKEKLFS
jgi:hypothetical protein